MKPITVLLAEDHCIVREGLRLLLQCEPDIKVVGEADNGRDAVRLATELNPSVIVMDTAMPQLNGIEATRQILNANPAGKVIILSAYSDEAYVNTIMSLGAFGYLMKHIAAKALPKAIRDAHQGRKCLSPFSFNHKSRNSKSTHSLCRLTPRELEMLLLIAKGSPNKESAALLKISIKTVEKHRQNLMDKLNIHDTAGLTRHAISLGLVESMVETNILT
jgi:DNA-binding NarL/FixJ family response regulator